MNFDGLNNNPSSAAAGDAGDGIGVRAVGQTSLALGQKQKQ